MNIVYTVHTYKYNRGIKYRGPLRPNYPSNFV